MVARKPLELVGLGSNPKRSVKETNMFHTKYRLTDNTQTPMRCVWFQIGNKILFAHHWISNH